MDLLTFASHLSRKRLALYNLEFGFQFWDMALRVLELLQLCLLISVVPAQYWLSRNPHVIRQALDWFESWCDALEDCLKDCFFMLWYMFFGGLLALFF